MCKLLHTHTHGCVCRRNNPARKKRGDDTDAIYVTSGSRGPNSIRHGDRKKERRKKKEEKNLGINTREIKETKNIIFLVFQLFQQKSSTLIWRWKIKNQKQIKPSFPNLEKDHTQRGSWSCPKIVETISRDIDSSWE